MFSAGLFCIMGAALLTDDGGQRGADMGMDMNFREDMCRIFNKYAGAMKVRSLKWYSRGGGKTADRKIERFIRYFVLPITSEEVISLLDTTVFKTGKEGMLFTFSGILIKEPLNRLFYLKYCELERAEVVDVINEDGWKESSDLMVYFKDGTERKLFDGYIRKNFFADYVNESIKRVLTDL